MDRLYSIKAAAKVRFGGISHYTVEAWLSKGKLLRTKVGRRAFISESEIQRFLGQCGSAPSGGGRQRKATKENAR